MKTVFISTAIDYVNASPHLGHALEKIQADVIARYHRSLGDDVLFLTGTDENSLKNVQSAEKQGIGVKELVDMNYKKFHKMKDILNLSYDDFIRTTEERHIIGAEKLWNLCQKDIYKKKYKGLYCVGCEEFYKEEELDNPFYDNLEQINISEAWDLIDYFACSSEPKEEMRHKVDILYKNKIDVTAFLVWFIDNYPNSIKEAKNLDFIYSSFH